jgi:hypothetical protein
MSLVPIGEIVDLYKTIPEGSIITISCCNSQSLTELKTKSNAINRILVEILGNHEIIKRHIAMLDELILTTKRTNYRDKDRIFRVIAYQLKQNGENSNQIGKVFGHIPLRAAATMNGHIEAISEMIAMIARDMQRPRPHFEILSKRAIELSSRLVAAAEYLKINMDAQVLEYDAECIFKHSNRNENNV